MESWQLSVTEAIDCGAPHVSVYMLEVDEDSRLGRELIAGGTKYHAHFVPDEDLTADFYVSACERLEATGVRQYEISNFAREGCESRHNLKYWERQPYMGFGVDAHSMLRIDGQVEAVRFAPPDSLEDFLAAKPLTRNFVSCDSALEETFFLGLRLNRGLDLRDVARQFGDASLIALADIVPELVEADLLEKRDEMIRLTPRGRLLSNEVFAKFISSSEGVSSPVAGEEENR